MKEVKNRVVQFPKRFKLIPVDGQPDVYDFEAITGEVIEEGTPIDKDLFDSIDEAIGEKQDQLTFDETPTSGSDNPVKSKGIKEALEKVKTEDLMVWAKDIETLKLGNFVPNTNTGMTFSGDYSVLNLTYGNGTWACSLGGNGIAYTTNPASGWTIRSAEDVFNLGSNFFPEVYNIKYIDGTWIAVGTRETIATATSLGGTWTVRHQAVGQIIRDIEKGKDKDDNDIWCAVGGNATQWTSSSLTGTWIKHTGLGFGNDTIRKIMYANELWVAISSNEVRTQARIHTYPSGAYYGWYFELQNKTITGPLSALGYDETNDLWVIGGSGGLATLHKEQAWTANDNFVKNDNVDGAELSILDIYSGNGMMVFCALNGVMATATNPAGKWNTRDVDLGTAGICGASYGSGKWVVLDEYLNVSVAEPIIDGKKINI